MQIPFVDLRSQYQALKTDIDAAVLGVMERCDFILGSEVDRFEESFAQFVGARFAIGVGSGTEALHLMLRACGVQAGDEVVTVANTFVATLEAISLCGARPVLVDCDPETLLMDVDQVEAVLTPRTKVILAVHLYGQPVDMQPLIELAERRGVTLLEDAAHAHGAVYRGGRACGTMGMAAGFSFYPGKNLGAFGDAGAITTNDADLYARIKKIRNLGSEQKYRHELRGTNSRLDTLQAAVLNVKLRHLADWNRARQTVAGWYRAALAGTEGLRLPVEAPWTESHVYHLFVVRVRGAKREELMKRLADRGVATIIHYPGPVHLQPSYRDLGYGPGSFPHAEAASAEILSLPVYPELQREQVDYVVGSLAEALTEIGS